MARLFSLPTTNFISFIKTQGSTYSFALFSWHDFTGLDSKIMF